MPPPEKLLLVDFENVRQINLKHLDESFQVVIFVGAAQKSIPTEPVISAQPLGSRIEWRRVDGNGSNALDFCIACELGRVLEQFPQAHCVVLSKDKGFDALLRDLNHKGLRCERLESLSKLDPERPAHPVESGYDRVLRLLAKREAKCRPGRRKSLTAFIRPPTKVLVGAEIVGRPSPVASGSRHGNRGRSPYKPDFCRRSIASPFQERLTPAEVDCLVDLLFSNGVVVETENALSYKF